MSFIGFSGDEVGAYLSSRLPLSATISREPPTMALVGDQSCTRHQFESSRVAVQSFSRSHAGKSTDAEKLRHPDALDKAMHFLVHHYLRCPNDVRLTVNHEDVWEYLWDRFRQIRTDWTKQLVVTVQTLSSMKTDVSAVELSLHRIHWLHFMVAGMFVASAVRCRDKESCTRFVGQHKFNYMETVEQTVTDLVLFYRIDGGSVAYAEMVSIVLLFTGLNLKKKTETHAHFCTWKEDRNYWEPSCEAVDLVGVYNELAHYPHMAATQHIQQVLQVLHCLHSGSWFEFFNLCKSLQWTQLQRCVLLCAFSYARFRAITTLCTLRPGGTLSRFRGHIPISELASSLLFDSDGDAEEFCRVLQLGKWIVPHPKEPDVMTLQLSSENSPAIKEPKMIHEHILSRKQDLMFPPHREFIALEPYFPAFPSPTEAATAFHNGETDFCAVTESGVTLANDVQHPNCPINAMMLLEPYCPRYSHHIASVELTDATSEDWFDNVAVEQRAMSSRIKKQSRGFSGEWWAVEEADFDEDPHDDDEPEYLEAARWNMESEMQDDAAEEAIKDDAPPADGTEGDDNRSEDDMMDPQVSTTLEQSSSFVASLLNKEVYRKRFAELSVRAEEERRAFFADEEKKRDCWEANEATARKELVGEQQSAQLKLKRPDVEVVQKADVLTAPKPYNVTPNPPLPPPSVQRQLPSFGTVAPPPVATCAESIVSKNTTAPLLASSAIRPSVRVEEVTNAAAKVAGWSPCTTQPTVASPLSATAPLEQPASCSSSTALCQVETNFSSDDTVKPNRKRRLEEDNCTGTAENPQPPQPKPQPLSSPSICTPLPPTSKRRLETDKDLLPVIHDLKTPMLPQLVTTGWSNFFVHALLHCFTSMMRHGVDLTLLLGNAPLSAAMSKMFRAAGANMNLMESHSWKVSSIVVLLCRVYNNSWNLESDSEELRWVTVLSQLLRCESRDGTPVANGSILLERADVHEIVPAHGAADTSLNSDSSVFRVHNRGCRIETDVRCYAVDHAHLDRMHFNVEEHPTSKKRVQANVTCVVLLSFKNEQSTQHSMEVVRTIAKSSARDVALPSESGKSFGVSGVVFVVLANSPYDPEENSAIVDLVTTTFRSVWDTTLAASRNMESSALRHKVDSNEHRNARQSHCFPAFSNRDLCTPTLSYDAYVARVKQSLEALGESVPLSVGPAPPPLVFLPIQQVAHLATHVQHESVEQAVARALVQCFDALTSRYETMCDSVVASVNTSRRPNRSFRVHPRVTEDVEY